MRIPEAREIARHIRRMTLLLRNSAGPEAQEGEPAAGRPAGPTAESTAEWTDEPVAEGLGWWVLAQGGALDPEDFQAREAMREELLLAVRRAGVLVEEHVWVWDESGRAQLVLSTLPTLERARRVGQRLRNKGLVIVVRREMP